MACTVEVAPSARKQGQIVYGADDRVDYFGLTDESARALVAASVVALVPSEVIQSTGGALAGASTWGDRAGLCAGEPFLDQPAAAFCSGVLVDWDLVLTAGHCTRLYAIQDFRVVFGYYFEEPGQLATTASDIVPIAEIVAEQLDPEGTEPRLDYAWLRLERPVRAPRQPALIHRAPPVLEPGDPVIVVGAPGGVPLKWDAGGHAQDIRAAWGDYFTVDADTSGGSSGGGAFDHDLGLLGIVARGGTDFFTTPEGCQATFHEADAARTAEQFTYAFRAVSALCASAGPTTSICRPDCGSPCQALPFVEPPGGGCSIAPRGSDSVWRSIWLSLLVALPGLRRRRRDLIACRYGLVPTEGVSSIISQ
jgi:hypothetical protein